MYTDIDFIPMRTMGIIVFTREYHYRTRDNVIIISSRSFTEPSIIIEKKLNEINLLDPKHKFYALLAMTINS